MALGAAGDGAADVGLRGGAVAGRQNEFLQARQLLVVGNEGFVERQHGFGLEQLVAGNGQLAAQIEQLVLDLDQQRAHIGGHVFAQQQANVGVEFVHIAHGVHAQAVLGYAGVVAQAGGAGVAGSGGDLCESVAHGNVS